MGKRKFKRGDVVRLIGHKEPMTVCHMEETEANFYYVSCFSREEGGVCTFYSDQLRLVKAA